MKIHMILSVASLLAATTPAFAQHEGHQMPGAPAATTVAQPAGECAEATSQTLPLIEQTQGRLEAARETNNAQSLRAALDEAQTTLADMKQKLAACRTAAQPQTSTPTAPPASQSSMPGMSHDHANMGHAMPMPAEHAGMNHSKMGHDTTPAAPASGDKMCPVSQMPGSDRHTAEYQGKTYHFCSEVDRQKFVANPEKYVGADKQAR